MNLPELLLGALLGAVVGAWVNEATDWCPNLAKHLVSRGARCLPEQYRGRYEEEWLAELAKLEGRKLIMLWVAIRILCGVHTTTRLLSAAQAVAEQHSRPSPVVGTEPSALLLPSPTNEDCATLGRDAQWPRAELMTLIETHPSIPAAYKERMVQVLNS